MFRFRKPTISVVVLVHRMPREAPRTLYSLTPSYQRGVRQSDYEVIMVENPSSTMLRPDQVTSCGRNFRYAVHPGDPQSPAAAMNFGASLARGRHLMLMIDGARILSPRILQRTLAALRLYDRSVVAALAWHLGPDVQSSSIHHGYCQEVEDRLLASVEWQRDGYLLFTISSLAGSCRGNWFGPISESNCLTLDRQHYAELGGFCEDFQTLGGGFVNLDFFQRAVNDARRPTVLLLGEGTFHQVHGGAATNRRNDAPLEAFKAEYQRIRGRKFAAPSFQPVLFGHMPEVVKPFMRPALRLASQQTRMRFPSVVPPLAAPRCAAGSPPLRRDVAAARVRTRVLAVLGMHRSGTSCLAGTLMECGVFFGDVSRKNRYNAKGNNENQQIMDLQDRLLADSGGSWKSPPQYVLWNDDHRRTRDAIIAQYRAAGQPQWGFKDPRTLLTLHGWQEALPELQPVGIFRHPDAVAQSLTKRNLFAREKGLDLWYQYNRRLLAAHQVRPFPIIRFDGTAAQFRVRLQRLLDDLQIQPPGEGFTFFDPGLQHCQPVVPRKLPTHVLDVLTALQQIADSDSTSVSPTRELRAAA